MREFDYSVLNEIKQEILFIFEVHKSLHIEGKMRVYTIGNQRQWKSHEPGVEIWFGPEEIDNVINKLGSYYKNGLTPNSPLLLDPVLYKMDDLGNPVIVGTGVVWCTILCNPGQKISDIALKRINDVSVFCKPFLSPSGDVAGIKVLAFLADVFIPEDDKIPPDGLLLDVTQSIADLVDINSDATTIKHYLLSGLQYQIGEQSLQHPAFTELFNGKTIETKENIRANTAHRKSINDSAICWNAFDREQTLYERYGVNVDFLRDNLRHREQTLAGAKVIEKELQLLWRIQSTYGLEGKMRVFTAPSQNIWRAKEEGVECWYGPEETEIAAAKIQQHYNAGKLPNSPMLLDPVVYKENSDGAYSPYATALVWATGLALGVEKIDEKAIDRVRGMGLFAGEMSRGNEVKGLKAFGILDEPYYFPPEEESVSDNPVTENGEQESSEEGSDDKSDGIRDALSIPGCHELYRIMQVSGQDYMPYYLLSDMEYLSGHGAFENQSIENLIGDISLETEEDIKKHTVSLKYVKDAAICWDAYDHNNPLWLRFGVDADNLESNLRYYNMCARDFSLLDATDMSHFKQENAFEFFVENWIPRGSVSMLAATAGVGKSTIAHRLAMISAINWDNHEGGSPAWLGSKVSSEFSKGLVIYFSGEDGNAVFGARNRGFDLPYEPKRLMFQRKDFGNDDAGNPIILEKYINKLLKLPDISLVIVDPGVKYLSGSDADSEAVISFFDALDSFAVEKSCAVLVTHPLVKRAKPDNIKDIADLLRGDEAFFDRPRVIIGAMEDGQYTIAGLAKNSLPPDLEMVDGERVFSRNPSNLDLTLLPGGKGEQ